MSISAEWITSPALGTGPLRVELRIAEGRDLDLGQRLVLAAVPEQLRDAEADGRYDDVLAMLGNVG
ncbi:hypothetical protein OG607_05035 [Streptomyces sp. NBC_01537]|uniref:hypothetical protein n=1 Tax=Streptomyces sp. NBC_01537 TaxID=2903896 RepID=UPI003862E739